MNQGLVAVVLELAVGTKIVATVAVVVDAMESAGSDRLPAMQALCQVFAETRFHRR